MVKVSSDGKGPLIEEVDGVFHISGDLNDHTDLSQLEKAKPPLAINFRELKTINSIGSRSWFKFLDVWGTNELRLFACPPCLVSLFNLAPRAIGVSGDRNNVKSVMLPYYCEVCNHYMEIEVSLSQQTINEREVRLPDSTCEACGSSEMRLIPDPDDYFTFYIS